ncbi:MAG: hypothetical protein M3P24_04650 [Gemmatimonadota bacterium]|nr:hypothetical protein [Gemmatimonadota bacterium]
MNRPRVHPSALPLLAAGLLLAACGGGGEEKGPAATPAAMDTLNQQEIDGLSREQIRQRAEPMTQEQARALGIIDTTIHMESMTSDTIGHPPDPAAASEARAEGARDTVARDSTP